MSSTTPNKEAIRRICLLHKASFCYLMTETKTEYADLYIDIESNQLKRFQYDLESWCGMKFKLYNHNSNEADRYRLINNGEKIYPLNTN